ncbi:MAG: phosphoketolase [Rickettsiales bacterium]|jgi:phosphoketolase
MTNKSIWEKGYGVVKHSNQTKKRIEEMLSGQIISNKVDPYELLIAADHLTNASIWLAVHQAYAKNVYLDGRELAKSDFKDDPQGHLGASLNMIPAYVGYMLANALTGFTRGWIMEQGHGVAAIDSTNLLLNNMNPAHRKRYNLSDDGLTRFAQDFYSYKLNEKGEQDSPLGSHVNPHTAGGSMEGGYLGFASLQYPHIPLVGERLVAFLSDGAFEEQRGSDWAPRWWRAEDSGLIAPIMISNGRRIDQRTTMDQEGGAEFFAKHLKLYGFDPIIFDGRDPAAFAWSIIEQERRLQESSSNLKSIENYDIVIPYGIAVAPKGAGFYNEGTNYAHNLPLVDNPSKNDVAAKRFNVNAQKLFVPFEELNKSIKIFQNHKDSKRVLERDNPIANREVNLKKLPKLIFKELSKENVSPMDAIDDGFLSIVKANPHLRARVGNPDEILSNRMDDTLEYLEFRVVKPEEGAEESSLGKVITALNEEAVAAAAFGNKGGINIIVTYEAFGTKMFGGARQEVIFSKHKKDIGKPAKWLSIPIILTSNTWENSKNELSHQDPSMAESMLSETSDISRVIFPADFNNASEVIKRIYQTQGQIWTIIVPKRPTALFFNKNESEELLRNGAIRVGFAGYDEKNAKVTLIAIGAYQLAEILIASKRLKEHKVPHIISYILEPGKFREARNEGEKQHLAPKDVLENITPNHIEEVLIVSHTRPELMIGTLQPLWQEKNVRALGFINSGGTLGVDDLLFVNKCSFAHILQNVENMLKLKSSLLSIDEVKALKGEISPDGIITKLKY